MEGVDIDYTKIPKIVEMMLDQNMDKSLREIVKITFLELKSQKALYVDSIETVYSVPGVNNMVANVIEKSYFDQKINHIGSAGKQARDDIISLVLMHDIRLKTRNVPISIVDEDCNYIKRDLSVESDADGTIIPQLELQFDTIHPKPHLGRALFFQLILSEREGILSIMNALNIKTASEAKILEKNISEGLLRKVENLYPSTYKSEKITEQNLEDWKMEKIHQICLICQTLLRNEKTFLEEMERMPKMPKMPQLHSDYNQYIDRSIAQCNNDINRISAILVASSLRYKDAKTGIKALLTTKPEDIKNLLIQLINAKEANDVPYQSNKSDSSSQTKSFVKQEILRNHEIQRVKVI